MELIGLLGGAAGSFGAGVVVLAPAYLKIGWFLIGVGTLFGVPSAIGLVALTLNYLSHQNRRDSPRHVIRMISGAGMIVCFIGFIGFAIAYFQADNDTPGASHLIAGAASEERVAPPFPSKDEIAERFPDMGEPIGDVITTNGASIEVHTNAVLLWISPANLVIRLNDGGKFGLYEDNNKIPNAQALDEAYVRRELGLPDDYSPPLGAFYYLWKFDLKHWSPIGPATWRSYLIPKLIRYRKYERGYVVSGLPKFESGEVIEAFYLRNDTKPVRDAKRDQIGSGIWKRGILQTTGSPYLR